MDERFTRSRERGPGPSLRPLRVDASFRHAARRALVSRSTVRLIDDDWESETRWSDLMNQATLDGARLLDGGIGPGRVVGVVAGRIDDTVRGVLAAWSSGAAVLALPRSSGGATSSRIRALVDAAEPDVLIGGPSALSQLPPDLGSPVSSFGDLGSAAAGTRLRRPDRVALLQATSGTTLQTRFVALSWATIVGHVEAIIEHVGYDRSDRFLSWLPLFHDMGMIGFFALPMYLGAELTISSPTRFVSAPNDWMGLASQFGSTIIGGPTFAYSIAAKSAPLLVKSWDLSSVRFAVASAEPVVPDVMNRFAEALSSAGFSRKALGGAYGMAEACLAVTATRPGEGIRTVSHGGSLWSAVGTPLAGMEVRIERSEAGQGEEGEIYIRGPHVSTSYWKAQSPTTGDGWLRTGEIAAFRTGLADYAPRWPGWSPDALLTAFP